MTHGSLFSGIGGFDLAAQWMGWENVFHCEKDTFCQKVLKYHFPNSIQHDDIKQTDFTIYRRGIDVLTGGFPCQPYSTAGLRKGKDDERHLWPEMLRAIKEIQPRWIVVENVLGLVNWSDGLVFEEVHTDLEREGYEVQAYILPAASVGAPHQRYRVFFIAYSNRNDARRPRPKQNIRTKEESERKKQEWQRFWNEFVGNVQAGIITDPTGKRWFQDDQKHEPKKPSQDFSDWNNFPTQSPVCFGNDGISTELDGITFSRLRRESIKSGGNAVVPQLPFQIFKTIEQYEKQ